jgi:hypothetical protein
VRNFIEGEPGSVIIFGPTGSGKTFTMQGKSGNLRGVLPRSVEEILCLIGASGDQIQHFSGGESHPILNINTDIGASGADRVFLRA